MGLTSAFDSRPDKERDGGNGRKGEEHGGTSLRQAARAQITLIDCYRASRQSATVFHKNEITPYPLGSRKMITTCLPDFGQGSCVPAPALARSCPWPRRTETSSSTSPAPPRSAW